MYFLPLSVFLLVSFRSISTEPIKEVQKNVTVEGFNGAMTKEILASLKDVEVLNILRSNITSYPSHVFSLLPNLRSVTILNSHFDIMDSNIYEDANKLEDIYFAHNGVPDLPLTLLRHTTFEKIVISDQGQVKEIPKNFANETKRLKYFECSGCQISNIQDEAFNNLDKLEVLNLDKNSIKHISREVLAPLKKLRTLYLHKNLIEKLTTDDIPELPDLRQIILSGNPLKELNLFGIEKVAPNLTMLDIRGTHIEQSVIDEHIKKTKIMFVSGLL